MSNAGDRSVLLFRAGLTGVAGLEPIYPTTTPTLANPGSSLAGADGDRPFPTLNSGTERGIPTELSLRSVGVPVAEGEVFLIWVARVGMVVVLGELWSGSDSGPSSEDIDKSLFTSLSLGGDDSPARTGVAGLGIAEPEEDSSLDQRGLIHMQRSRTSKERWFFRQTTQTSNFACTPE